jgi:glycosyltransferase involved in cell wall biosynthesis
LPQHDFAEQLGKAGLMILPTDYPEICSNTILQSLASGTPIVTTGDLGSADEWVVHEYNGYLTNFHVHDYMIHTLEMVRGASKIIENRRLHEKMIRNATRTKYIYSWDEIGKKWHKMLCKLL